MKVRPQFPAYATKNCDFVTGQRKDGRVLDLQVDVETLPAVGMLCVHENTVKAMVTKLGWKLEKDDELEAAQAQVADLKAQLVNMQEIVAALVSFDPQPNAGTEPEPLVDVLSE